MNNSDTNGFDMTSAFRLLTSDFNIRLYDRHFHRSWGLSIKIITQLYTKVSINLKILNTI